MLVPNTPVTFTFVASAPAATPAHVGRVSSSGGGGGGSGFARHRHSGWSKLSAQRLLMYVASAPGVRYVYCGGIRLVAPRAHPTKQLTPRFSSSSPVHTVSTTISMKGDTLASWPARDCAASAHSR